MGANGSYDKTLGGVPLGKRTHIETGHTILGHKVLLQDGTYDQTKNILNSNSESPIYLIAKQYEDGSLAVLNINQNKDHEIDIEINLKFDSNGKIRPYNGKESSSHAHQWEEGKDGIMHRKPTTGNSHLPIPKGYGNLLKAIEKFNKQKNHIKK